ncbi:MULTISPECIES: alkaline phosphatase [Peribacillus]|uniref:alkaline phosphatase n=1 Tax=Peribacillus TaxID=2675229 RepID=UPI0024E1DA85|nr:alkaline phosphatase [Peribacillus simplex]MDF9758850.1 alkaline phosphatase [Peribacillus simplex]
MNKTSRSHKLLQSHHFGLLVLICFICMTSPIQAETKNTPRNVILLIGDGMGLGAIEIARQMEYGKTGILHLEKLEHVALMRTYSANNYVTDSAAGGSAIATGIKTNNESIGVDANGSEVDSVLDAFQAKGKKVGIISTNMVVDATPAAFGASVSNRWTGGANIARQLFDNRIDVILGGGSSYFEANKQNGEDLIAKFKQAGYGITTTKEELSSINKPEKLLGLFHPTYMNFKLDKEVLHSQEPSLPEMTSKAIDILSQSDKGFFLMSEGARIDHMEHAADITGIWKETIEFDQTVKEVVNWAKNRNDTLIVVLADHETMGTSASETMDIPALKKIRVSSEYMSKQLIFDKNHEIIPESVVSAFKKYAHISLTDQEVHQFIDNVKKNRTLVYPQHQIDWEIGSTIAKHYKAGVADRSIRAASSTGGHTANMIPIFASGPGSEAFDGVIENTDVSKIITKAAGVPFTPGQHKTKEE